MQEEISSLTILVEKTRNKNADLTKVVAEQETQVFGGRPRSIPSFQQQQKADIYVHLPTPVVQQMENLKKKTSAMKSQEEELASLQELRTVVEDLRGENDALRDNMTKIKSQRDEWMLKLEGKVEEQDAYMQRVNELSEENSALESSVAESQDIIKSLESKVFRLRLQDFYGTDSPTNLFLS